MSTRNILIVVIGITLLMLAAGALVYARMPERAANHWNQYGQADGYSSPLSALFLLPGIALATGLLMVVVPLVDPRRANIALFRREYNWFVVAMMLFMAYLHTLTILWNLGVRFNMNQMLIPAMGVFIYLAGVLLGRAKPNYMIGIRTPWTLASESVWYKTHTRGGLLFKVSGVLAMLGALLPQAAFPLLMIPLLGFTLYLVIYSYVLYRGETRGQ